MRREHWEALSKRKVIHLSSPACAGNTLCADGSHRHSTFKPCCAGNTIASQWPRCSGSFKLCVRREHSRQNPTSWLISFQALRTQGAHHVLARAKSNVLQTLHAQGTRENRAVPIDDLLSSPAYAGSTASNINSISLQYLQALRAQGTPPVLVTLLAWSPSSPACAGSTLLRVRRSHGTSFKPCMRREHELAIPGAASLCFKPCLCREHA